VAGRNPAGLGRAADHPAGRAATSPMAAPHARKIPGTMVSPTSPLSPRGGRPGRDRSEDPTERTMVMPDAPLRQPPRARDVPPRTRELPPPRAEMPTAPPPADYAGQGGEARRGPYDVLPALDDFSFDAPVAAHLSAPTPAPGHPGGYVPRPMSANPPPPVQAQPLAFPPPPTFSPPSTRPPPSPRTAIMAPMAGTAVMTPPPPQVGHPSHPPHGHLSHPPHASHHPSHAPPAWPSGAPHASHAPHASNTPRSMPPPDAPLLPGFEPMVRPGAYVMPAVLLGVPLLFALSIVAALALS